LRSKTFFIIDEVIRLNKSEGLIVLFNVLPTEDKVRLLDQGADDIISMPIELSELTARIRAIIRRKKFESRSKVYFGNIVIDIFSKTVSVWSTLVSLTKTEFDILLYLISNKSKVVSKISLAEYIWGESSENLDTFDSLFTHIKNLRRKLKEVKAEVEFRSIYGVGYQIIEL
jgi:DNA-binding response OmpR family regulator